MTHPPIPKSVKTFGILHLVFGTFQTLVSFLEVRQRIDMLSGFSGEGSEVPPMLQAAGMTFFLYPVLGVCMIIVGIGLLQKRRWSRRAAIAQAWTSLGLAIASFLLIVITLFSDMGNTTMTQALIAVGIFVFALVSNIPITIYPIITLVFLNKPHVKLAFTPAPATPDHSSEPSN